MDFIDSSASTALAAAAALLLTLFLVRRRGRHPPRPRGNVRDALDTVQDRPPEPARVMTVQERAAYELLRRAVPGYMWLGSVVSFRARTDAAFVLRVAATRGGAQCRPPGVGETRFARAGRDRRAGQLGKLAQSAAPRTSGAGVQAAGVRVQSCGGGQGHLPGAAEVRTALAHDLLRGTGPMEPVATLSRPMPLIPVAETHELDAILAAGDAAAVGEG